MSSESENSKRIAKNTAFLYLRMIVVMVIGLFTSRVTLSVLGVSDYGVYNVIGGMVSMLSVLTGAISVATSRYLTYSLGLGDSEGLKKTFSTALNIHIILGIIIGIIAEVAGIWFLNSELNIPQDRMYVANWILQFSIITFVIGIIVIPYNSSIISHEKMNIYAYLSLFDVVVKLVIVYLLYISPIDRLLAYGILLLIASISTQFIYYVYCRRHFEECRFRLIFDKGLVKEMSSFIGWAFWGNAAVMAKNQGLSILLNIFFGTIVNAAQGIAMQVNNAVTGFIRNFMTAVNPQITKSYAQKNYEYLYMLINRSAKFSVFLALVLMIPIIMHIDTILGVWLVEVPLHANNFVTMILIYTAVEGFISPLLVALLATGKIKNYEIGITIVYILNILSIYVFFKFGSNPEMAFVLNIIFKIIVLLFILYQSKLQFHFPIKMFLKDAMLRPIAISLIGLILIVFYNKIIGKTTIVSFLVSCVLTEIILMATIWFYGMSCSERGFIKETIINKNKRKNQDVS